MKYILEIKPEYEDSFKGVMILGAKDSNLFVDTLAVENLEELTSDYINEHFGDLQDTAYRKGRESVFHELEISGSQKGESADDAYQRGLEDGKQVAVGAAELREKLEYQKGFKDGKAQAERGCEGCQYIKRTIFDEPCVRCSNAYKSQWTAKDDKIEVGDIVERYLNDKLDSTGIYLGDADEKGDYWNCLFWTGESYITLGYPKHQLKKTGRHFDIASILEEMRND